jgi:hypothetical protein
VRTLGGPSERLDDGPVELLDVRLHERVLFALHREREREGAKRLITLPTKQGRIFGQTLRTACAAERDCRHDERKSSRFCTMRGGGISSRSVRHTAMPAGSQKSLRTVVSEAQTGKLFSLTYDCRRANSCGVLM